MTRKKQNVIVITYADRQLIEDEHAHLARLLCDLCDVCSAPALDVDCQLCSREKVASCQGRLPSFFHDFREFANAHFEHEEKIAASIKSSSTDGMNLKLHRQAHANLMREINQLIQESSAMNLQGNVRRAIRHFHQLILDKFGEHTGLFDDPMLLNP